MFGEPTGTELGFRSHFVGPAQNIFVRGYASQPTSLRYLTQLRAKLKKEEPARYKAAEQIKKLIAEKKWRAAEDLLYQQLDRLNIATGYLSSAEVKQLQSPFADVTSVVDTAALRLRAERAKQAIQSTRMQQAPDYSGILAEIEQAINNVATTGQTVWKDGTVDGPQLVEKIGIVWKEAHVATLRCRALDWAYMARTNPAGSADSQGSIDPLQKAYVAFSGGVLKAIENLLTVEASRIDGDETVPLYVRYLATLPPLLDQVADRGSLAPIDQALQALANELAAFGGEVDAYDRGTAEMLRWRARAAEAAAKSREPEFVALPTRMFEATKSDQSYVGLFTAQQPQKDRPRLLACAPKLLPPAIKKLVGQKARVGSVRRITPTSRSFIAEFDNRTYANLTAELPLAAEVDLLKFDLMVSAEAPALTLASAMAVSSAERGDLAAAGGEITGTHLEGLITRFATLPTAASVLVPLGQLPSESQDYLLPQVLMRFELQPSWAQHEHFFVQLSAAGAE
jgi:hypothetical protein